MSTLIGSGKTIYIVAGCNGAGKTTTSFTILPEIIHCQEFINADEIARGLSPFQPETVAFEAGRIMLERMDTLIDSGETFAFETTLASRTFPARLEHATNLGFDVILLFFWLQSPDLAIARVRQRVSEGGHAIPTDIIQRRYKRGLINLFEVYLSLSHLTFLFDNSAGKPELIARKVGNGEWSKENELSYEKLFSAYEYAKEI